MGGLYSPVVEIVPSVVFPLTIPSTNHVTAVLAPVTNALNCCVWVNVMDATRGLTVTAIWANNGVDHSKPRTI